MGITFSIIIPAHNEAERLPAVLQDYVRYFADRMGDAFELLVIANHCNDDTAAAARRIAAVHPQVRVIEEKSRIGKGGAVIMGVRVARGEWIGFVDADGATAPSEFARLFDVAQKADGVIGSRWLPGARVVIHQKRLRLLSSRVFNFFIRLMLGLNYKDTQCGAKIFKAEVWRKILPNIGITRFAFDVDLLFQVCREKFSISEEPTEWHDVAGSKVNIFASSIDMFLAIVRMRLLYSSLKPLVALYDRTIAGPVEFLRTDPLFRHTVLLSAAAMVVNLCNLSFQMVVGRALPHAEYTLLAAFLAVFGIAGRPFGTLATAMNHFTSVLLQEGKRALLGRLMTKWGLLTAVPSLLIALLCTLFASRIAAFFHLDRTEPVIVAALAIPAVFCAPVFLGAVSGMQRFGLSALATTLGAVARVALGAFFVYGIYPACGWALVGHTGGLYVTFAIVLIVLAPYIITRTSRIPGENLPSLRRYIFWSFLVELSVAVLMTGDVIMVRHYLPLEEEFAYAATMSRMIVFFSGAVAVALFPKVATAGAFTPEHRRLYLRALAYTGAFAVVSLLVCIGLPEISLRLMFGLDTPGEHLVGMTRWMGVVMGLSVLLQLNVSLLLAQRRFRLLFVSILCALAYICGVHFWGDTITSIIAIAGIASLAAFAVTTAGILWPVGGGFFSGLTKQNGSLASGTN